MSKKYTNRKERNKHLRISGEAKKAASIKRLKQAADECALVDVMVKINQHTDSLREKHPELFEAFQKAAKGITLDESKDINIRVREAAALATQGNVVLPKGKDAKDERGSTAIEITPAYLQQLREQISLDASEKLAGVATDIADQGEYGLMTVEQITQALLTGLLSLGVSIDEGRQYIKMLPDLVPRIQHAQKMINDARNKSITPMGDGLAIVAPYESPFARVDATLTIGGVEHKLPSTSFALDDGMFECKTPEQIREDMERAALYYSLPPINMIDIRDEALKPPADQESIDELLPDEEVSKRLGF